MRPVITNRDVRHCIETYQGLLLEEDPDGPETVCLSFGYADVCHDGDVVAWGRVVVNVDGLDTDGIPEDDEPYAVDVEDGDE